MLVLSSGGYPEASHGGGTKLSRAANLDLAGICIVPGDYIYADTSGAVAIPAASLQQVLQEAQRIEAEDTESLNQIHGENTAASDGHR